MAFGESRNSTENIPGRKGCNNNNQGQYLHICISLTGLQINWHPVAVNPAAVDRRLIKGSGSPSGSYIIRPADTSIQGLNLYQEHVISNVIDK